MLRHLDAHPAIKWQVIQGKYCQIFPSNILEMNGMFPFNDDTSMTDASLATIGGGCSRKRKRREPIDEPHVIIGQSTHDHSAECGDQGDYNEKVLFTAQQSLVFDQDAPGVRQQMTVKTHIQQTSTVDCNHVLSGHVNAEQVCFGMVCIINSCCFSPPVIAEY